jgi:hypothetical protein
VVAKRENNRAEHDTDARPFCTLQSCPTFDVKKYLHQLQRALPCVPPIPVQALTSLYTARDYEGMVQLIKKAMNVEVRLVVGWVNCGGPQAMKDAPAWIEFPPNMPFYGSNAFRELKLTMFLRKSFLAESKYDQVAIAIAHELSHVVLESIEHPLRRCEKAVDLTAMLLGFRQLYASGSYKEERSRNSTRSRTLGYLSREEVELANRILTPERSKINVIQFLLVRRKALALALLLVGIFGSFTAKELYRVWELHHTLLTAQLKVGKHMPLKVSPYLTLVDARVGVTALTFLHAVTGPKGSTDFTALERVVRKNVCASPLKSLIGNGASFNYEYRDTSHELIRLFEIASCS